MNSSSKVIFAILLISAIFTETLARGVPCGEKKAGEYCATTSQCSPGFQCCAYCPTYAICGPDTEFKPSCRWGSCEERKNYLQFTDDDLIFL